MGGFLFELRKHLKLWRIFMKNSLIAQLEYRANFYTGIAMEIGYLLAKVVYLIVVYKTGVSINGLSPDEILVFFGSYMIVTGSYVGFYMMNLFEISNKVSSGDFDLILVKPASTQFLLTLRRSDMACLTVDVLAGLVAVGIGVSRLNLQLNVLSVLGYIGYVAAGSIVGYGIFLLPQLLAFRMVKTNAIAAFVDSLWDFNNMPMGIYNKLIQGLGVFLIPIFVVTNFPALFILRKMSLLFALWGIAAPILLLMLTRVVFRRALRQYTSASS